MRTVRNRARFERVSYLIAAMIDGIFILSLFLILLAVFPKKAVQADNTVYEEYVIEAGDTLWGIASKNKKADEDIREYIYELQELNEINCDLQIGQVIKIIK